jgi:hypothetical protein
VILMAAAGGQDTAIGMCGEKLADNGDALFGSGQVVKTEFEKGFSGVNFPACMFQQLLRVGKTQGNADPR